MSQAVQVLGSHESARVRATEQGGLVVERDSGVDRVEPVRGGWSVELCGFDERLALTEEAHGFVIACEEPARELGRTSGIGPESPGQRSLLLDDGRLFLIELRGARGEGFDLVSQEVPGAYVRAITDGEGWSLVPTPAAAGLEDIRVMSLLLAVEALRADGRLPART